MFLKKTHNNHERHDFSKYLLNKVFINIIIITMVTTKDHTIFHITT